MKKVLFLTLVVMILIVIKVFVFEVVVIDSSSMFPTLRPGDYIVINKLSDKMKVSRGEIVTFNIENSDELYIKRVMAVSGDNISIKDDVVSVNEKVLSKDEIQLSQELPFELSLRQFIMFNEKNDGIEYNVLIDEDKVIKAFEKSLVSEKHFFVLGDNRNHSIDSRIFGNVKNNGITGTAMFVVMNLRISWPWESGSAGFSFLAERIFKKI